MSHDRKMLDREAVRSVIQQWNANRLDLFALSEPDENLLFHGVMRFYFQDAGQKVATKCIRVASDATVTDVIDTLIEKFRPDMRMLSVPNYALYEVHANGEERRLNPDEKPLLVQLNWHIDDREGRFLLKNIDQKTTPIEHNDINFKRKLSKREKKEQKKKNKLAKLNSDGTSNGPSHIPGGGTNGLHGHTNGAEGENQVAGKLYTELPETSFTRSISNPEAVMRRRRQQKLEKKLQQFRSRDGGPDTGGTLKIYGESLCQDVPYKTLLLSIRDCAQAVVREMLTKYGLEKADPLHYCLVQVNSDGSEYILDDDECPLSILMNHPTSRGSIMFHVRRRPADSQPRRRKKKPLGAANGTNHISHEREGPMLVEVTHSGDGGRRIKLSNEPVEVGSANTNCLQLFGPSIQPRHCLISLVEGVCTVTPLHTDALTFVNGHHITQPTILHNGSVVMFGRVASYRFVDSPTDGRYNLALSQSQLDSACLYESRSPTSPGSWNDEDGALSSTHKSEYEHHHHYHQQQQQPQQQQQHQHHHHQQQQQQQGQQQSSNPHTSAELTEVDGKLRANGNESNNHHTGTGSGSYSGGDAQSLEGNLENETKSISSLKSAGSNSQERFLFRSPKLPSSSAMSIVESQGQEPILPAVLEFPETHQDLFLRHIITELDVNSPHFKLAPVYSLYLCARYRASTHYRPELQPTERAHKLTKFLHHVASLIYNVVVQEQYKDQRILAFWMANSSEFLHFLKSDRHISAFSVQAQEVLAESVQTAFRNLVNCFRVELSQTLNQFLSETIDHGSAAGLVLTVLGSAMALLRRCRVNAALTIQLFSQLFHYINVICFNTIVTNSHMCTAEWGKVMTERLQLLELWAERQGLELAADCHLAKINQCAQFLQAPKTSVEGVQQLACTCFRLNSLQMAALLQQEKIPRNLVDTALGMAESVADELTRADGREIRLEETPELHLALLLPDDGFSCDVVRGIPSGLVDFLNPLQQQGMCRLAAQPTSIGLWTVYMHQFNARSSSAMSNKLPQPEKQIIKLQKNSNGMGLSIVAAKGAGQERLGIYIKSVVPGGAADADGRLQAGDQLLRVDGQSLIGITQERAADYLVRTGPVVTLEVAKQGAIYHGLATLLQQPSPVIQRAMTNSKSRSTHSLANSSNPPANSNTNGNNGEQGFYQNLSVYRNQNQTQPILSERPLMPSHSAMSTYSGNSPQNLQNPIVSPISGTVATSLPQQYQHQPSQQHATIANPINGSNMPPPSRPMSAYYQSGGGNMSTAASAATGHHQQHQQHQQQQQQQQQQQHNLSHQHHGFTQHSHSVSASSTNLSHQQQQQQQQLQHQQHMQLQQHQPTMTSAHSSLTLNNRSKSSQNFNREMQTQQSLRMQPMMAPSMPNISNMYQQQQSATQYPMHQANLTTNQLQQMAASQSMQNVNVNSVTSDQYQNGPFAEGNLPSGYMQQHSPASLQTLRRNMRSDVLSSSHQANAVNAAGGENTSQHSPPNQINASQQQVFLQQQQQSNFITLPPKPGGTQQQAIASKQQLPPTAPKPQQQQRPPATYLQQNLYQQQQQQQQQQTVDEKPPLPPSTTHPLYKAVQQITPGMNYVASTLDPPKGGYVPVSGNTLQSHRNITGTNPWEREEREKEVEMRREHIRQWREQQINELSAIPQRSPQQEEQLKTLILERDFERRAQELEEQEDESEPSYEKEQLQEVFRLTQNQNTTIQTPVTNFRQTEIKVASVNNTNSSSPSVNAGEISPPSSAHNSAGSETTQHTSTPATSANSSITSSISGGVTTSTAPINSSIMQPKSILKNNRYDGTNLAPSSPSKSQKSTSFADDRHLQTEHSISSLARDISQLNLNNTTTSNSNVVTTTISPISTAPITTCNNSDYNLNNDNNNTQTPPPPPERNSSYLIMSQQKLRNSTNSAIGLLKTATSNSADLQKKTATNLISNRVSNNNSPSTLTAQQQLSPSLDLFNVSGSSMNSTSMLLRDNKRVSFHDEDNNYLPSTQLSTYTNESQFNNSITSPSISEHQHHNHHHHHHHHHQSTTNSNTSTSTELNTIREDTSFLQQSLDASMLPSMPATPDTAAWNTTVQSTPGVIGAQEVYRDPRQRRLAEKQQQQQQRSTEAVPEKLSFKEKMKMFALDSGEDHTPKDKLKISRAQRDIDAVH
ncbi:adherens junction formation factor afadin isoform 3-T4 [Glossina fuscipes fuscipes]